MKILHLRALLQGAEGFLHVLDSEKQQTETEQDRAHALHRPRAPADLEQESQADRRQGVQFDTDPSETRDGHQPCGGSGAHVAADDDADGLLEGEQTGIDQSDNNDRRSGARLDEGGHQRADGEADVGVLRHRFQDDLELATGNLLQTIRHQGHSEQEQPQTPDHPKNYAADHPDSFYCDTTMNQRFVPLRMAQTPPPLGILPGRPAGYKKHFRSSGKVG